MAIYGDRVADLPRILQVLYYHPSGMRFADLASEVGRPEDDVREILRVYYLTDLANYLPDLVARPETLEFFGGDSDDEGDDDGDPVRAPMVRLTSPDPGAELGVAYTSASELGRLYRIAYDASVLRPEDEVLASAVHKLHAGLLPSLRIVAPEPWDRLAVARAAIAEHRRVRLVYALLRAPIIEHIVVEPYSLIRTHRGWELDAGTLDAPADRIASVGAIRTFVDSYIREFEVLDETFVPPADLATLIRQFRTETAVVMDMPHDARWAVDKWAERVELLDDRFDGATLRVQLLWPVRLKVGLMLMVGGPHARVIEPAEFADAGREAARRMLRRYESEGWVTDRTAVEEVAAEQLRTGIDR